ncbi:MAG: methyltransferase domain-containing protein [Xanthobacteraceae bacterium]
MGALRDFELAGWQSAASAYDGFAGATGLFVPALVYAVGAKPGMRLLDIACGTGVAAQAAADAGARVTGVDFSSTMLAMAKSLHPAIEFHVGDAEALPFADASFDAAIANFGIHHVERPERAIAEAQRVLKGGGTFAFTVWADPQDNTAWRIIFDAVKACGRLDVPMPAGNDSAATRENFSRLMIEAGFDARTLTSRLLAYDWLLPPDADLVAIFETGTVRMATLLRGQGAALPAVREHVALALQSHLRDGAIVLPTRAWLISATA